MEFTLNTYYIYTHTYLKEKRHGGSLRLNTTKWHNFDNARVSRVEISLRFSFNILNKMSCFTPLYCKKCPPILRTNSDGLTSYNCSRTFCHYMSWSIKTLYLQIASNKHQKQELIQVLYNSLLIRCIK